MFSFGGVSEAPPIPIHYPTEAGVREDVVVVEAWLSSSPKDVGNIICWKYLRYQWAQAPGIVCYGFFHLATLPRIDIVSSASESVCDI